MRRFLLGIFVLCLFAATANAVDFPAFQNFVTDATGTLANETVAELNSKLANYEMQTGTEIAVALIASTDGMPIEQYATQLGNEWGVGKAQVDNGALLVIAVDDRELFLATGSQLEGALTDIEARDIIDEVITPRFKNGDFDGGISAGVDAITAAIAGESFTDLRTNSTASVSSSAEGILNVIFIFLFFGVPWLAAILGRSKKIWPGAALGALGGGIGGTLLISSLVGFFGGAIVLGLFGLLFDFIVSKNYAAAKKSGGHIAWWAGGSRFGGGGSGGFGGFGGGGFSGGGFGGKW
ncbi:MAG: TPM domain-containing protein [Patescibacteria group bacterium]